MKLTWLGTASFRIKTGDSVFLLDPYFSRNKKAKPRQYLNPKDYIESQAIFLSHGHFDHILDVPVIAEKTGSTVYCSETAADTLIGKGLDKRQTRKIKSDGSLFDFDGYQARAFFSDHVVFDKKLLAKSILRTNIRLFKYAPLLKDYPVAQVLSWRFTVEGQAIHFFGSAGSKAEEMEKLAGLKTDILLVPLQGHSDICKIALEYVRVMRPKIVIPHHHDNFFPPISSMIDIRPFIEGVKRECPDTEVRVLNISETISL